MEAHLRVLRRLLRADELTQGTADQLRVALTAVGFELSHLSRIVCASGGSEAQAAELAQLLRMLAVHSIGSTSLAQRFAAVVLEPTLASYLQAHTLTVVMDGLAEAASGALSGMEALEQAHLRLPPSCQLRAGEAAALRGWLAAILPAHAASFRGCLRGCSSEEDVSNRRGAVVPTVDLAQRTVQHLAARSHLPQCAAPLEQARLYVPFLLASIVPKLSGLELPGQPCFDASLWEQLQRLLLCLLATPELRNAAEAALAPRPGSAPLGQQLASTALALLRRLGEQWPSAAAADPEDAAEQCWQLGCLILAEPATLAHSCALAAQGPASLQLPRCLLAVLGRLQQWQACGALPPTWHVTLSAAIEVLAEILSQHHLALDSLWTQRQAAGQAGSRESQAHAQQRLEQRCLAASLVCWHVVAGAPAVAAVLSSGAAGEEASHVLEQWATLFTKLDHVFVLLGQAGFYPRWRQAEVEQLAPAMEAVLRCAARLQQDETTMCQAGSKLSGQAALACFAALICARQWAEQQHSEAGHALDVQQAERLLERLAALASIVQKLCTWLLASACREAAPLGRDSQACMLASVLSACTALSAVVLQQQPSIRAERLSRCIGLISDECTERARPLASPELLDWLPQLLFLQAEDELSPAGGVHGPALRRSQALAALPRCAHLACTNLAGASEAQLRTRACSGCRVARYCSQACQLADWRAGHRRVCAALAAARAAERGQAESAGSEG